MNSKFSKSEKTKLKFAQSNINHVYRGNAAETQHKPAVRQYGMQVVGKLQGTRRLPPPAWVPSLKAESGGVDGRVTLVPPGGSGWGATSNEPGPTNSSENVSTETVGPPITSTLPTLNGSLSRDAIETIFEPAYARSKFESTTAELTTTGSYCIISRDTRDISPDRRTAQVDGLSEHLATKVSLGIDSGSECLTKSPAWPPKTSVTVASGGLAANKPFFQRPTTLTTSASAPMTQSDLSHPPVSKTVGACEIVGEPTGWVALSNQEIDFDERILFSDEEDGQEQLVEAGGTTSAKSTTQTDYPVPKAQTPASIDTVTAQSMTVTLPKTDCVAPLDVPSANHSTSDIWSAPGGPMEFGLSSHSSSQHIIAQMSEASLLPVGSTERTLLDNQYLPHTTLSHAFNPAFNEHYFLNNLSQKSILPSASVGFTDSALPSIDVDTEIQHAQRQARTQEFRSAVERAQQARIAQQKAISRSTGDSSHQRSVVDIIRETSGSPTLQPHLAPPKFADSVLFPANQLPSHPFVGNAMQSQLFCPSSRIQATNQHRPDLAAAVAAATAVAVACNGNSGPSHVRSSGAMLPPSFVSASQPYQPFSAGLQSVATGLCDDWSSPFPSTPASSIDLRGTHSSTIPQVLHNTLTTGCPRGVSPRANTVFLNPDYLVEKFLEILNRQQGVQHSSDALINSSITDASANTTFSAPVRDRVTIQQPPDRGTSHVDARFACTPCNSDEFNSSGINESVSKTDSPHSSTIISTAQPDNHCTPSVTHTSPEHTEVKPEGKRVPGLMEVKVSTTSLDLAHLWEQNDRASSALGRGSRGSSKLFSNKLKPHGRGRRSVVFSSDASVSVNVNARTTHPHRASASPSTHVRQSTNVRDVEKREEMSVPDQRRVASGRDDRRYSSTQKFRRAAGSGYSRQRDYFHENRFSDGEQPVSSADGFRTHRRQSDVHPSRDDASPRLVSKAHGRDLNTDHAERKADGHSLDDRGESTELTSSRGRGASGFHPHFSSRGVRVSFSRGGGSWKSGKSLTLQQESKRTSGSHAQISRRYHGQRDRYDDGKDDEGGAAAGGAGRSNTGGEGSSAGGPGGTCGVDGHNNLSGNQKSGGNRESVPTNNHRGVLAASVSATPLTEGDVPPSSTVMTATDHRLYSDKGIYPRSSFRDRRHKEPSALISGQSSDTSQRFFRMNSNRERRHAPDRCRLNLSHIPPLMSIKPRSLFTHAERSSESATDNILDSTPNESGTLESVEGGASGDHDASDVDSVHSDGFTKVVSKASRKLARKRLQHEPPLNKSFRLQSSLLNNPSSSQTFQPTNSCKSSEFSTSVSTHRFKASYKPTFMGPPLSAISSMSTVSFGTSWATSNGCEPSETTENYSGRMLLQSSVDRPPSVQTSSNRTWSKVVGSKSKTVDSVNSPHDLPAHASDCKRSEPTAKPTTNTVTTTPQNALPVSTCSSNASPAISVLPADASNSSAVEYSSVQCLWSTNCLGQNEFPVNSTSESIDTSVPTSSPTIVRVATSSVLADPTAARTSGSTVANNICKVRPQQQQTSQPNVLQNKIPVAAPLAVSLTTEQSAVATTCVSEHVICGGEAFDADYGGGILRGPQPHSALDIIPVQSVTFSPPSAHASWVDSMAPQASSNFYTTRIGTENPITAGVWPTSDPVLDTSAAGIIPRTCVGQTFVPTTEVVSNVSHSSNTSTFIDPNCKPSHPAALFPRSQPYAVQQYPQTAISDFIGSYDNTFTGSAKLISSDTAQSQPMFSNMARSVYVSPDQQSSNQSHLASWGLPPNQHPQVPQPPTQQRYRPRLSHQPDASFGSFAYQPDLQNELAYLPAVTGCVPPMPSGGLYSAVQDQSQPGYAHASARHSVDSTGASSSWSIFGNPVGSSNFQTQSRDFTGSSTHAPTGNGGGLLPHPSLLTGYGSIPCSVASGPSSSSNFLAHQNFVGVIGGGRINTDMPDTPLRPRGLSPNIYPTHNVSQSTQSQPQFQVHSAFYPSLSPSHQRIQLHHCRANMHNLMNPQTGLYAAAFGAPSQPAQPTPPPLPTRVAYQNMASEPSVIPPMSFHSQLQSHSFQNMALQPRVPGPRAHQASAPHFTRNLASITNHATSPMLIAGAAGAAGLPGYAQPSPSLSGYPFKPVLPTL